MYCRRMECFHQNLHCSTLQNKGYSLVETLRRFLPEQMPCLPQFYFSVDNPNDVRLFLYCGHIFYGTTFDIVTYVNGLQTEKFLRRRATANVDDNFKEPLTMDKCLLRVFS